MSIILIVATWLLIQVKLKVTWLGWTLRNAISRRKFSHAGSSGGLPSRYWFFGGPYWAGLTSFVEDLTLYQNTDLAMSFEYLDIFQAVSSTSYSCKRNIDLVRLLSRSSVCLLSRIDHVNLLALLRLVLKASLTL